MLNAEYKQFQLSPCGGITFQPAHGNPMPGSVVGRVVKGESVLRPAVEVDHSALPEGVAPDAAKEKLAAWLEKYVFDTLQGLYALQDEETIPAPARRIADALHDALGVVPRADLEHAIAELDEEGRRALRNRKVRLGPVLVFLPLLNKPAAVRLRALLWHVWHGKNLPAAVPSDGMTSQPLGDDAVGADPAYYRAIGYPLYGGRAIRVDMFDRLVSAVYDQADKGVFKARHDMAECLGCSIPDLYKVLEAMGHQKIHDPAEQQAAAVAEDEKQEAGQDTTPAADTPADLPVDLPIDSQAASSSVLPVASLVAIAEEDSGTAQDKPDAPVQPQEKPDLATFRLRRGKAYGSTQPPRRGKTAHKKSDSRQERPSRNKKPRAKKPDQKKVEDGSRVFTAAPKKKDENSSPFAALKDLKVTKSS